MAQNTGGAGGDGGMAGNGSATNGGSATAGDQRQRHRRDRIAVAATQAPRAAKAATAARARWHGGTATVQLINGAKWRPGRRWRCRRHADGRWRHVQHVPMPSPAASPTGRGSLVSSQNSGMSSLVQQSVNVQANLERRSLIN